MDIDAVSSCDTYLKEGCCFLCVEKGHIQRACPQKDKKTVRSNNPFRQTASVETTPSKNDQIQAMLAALPQEQRDGLLKDFV